MKVLTVSATDYIGGAGIAAYRLHRGLLQAKIEAQMLVLRKVTADATVQRLALGLDRWGRLQRRVAAHRHRRQLERSPRRAGSGYWSLNLYDYPLAAVINARRADLVHLHWIGDNLLSIPQLARIEAPIVWTLHDMWAFSGGCHSADDCHRYRTGCGSCPQLQAATADDISARVCERKRRAWAKTALTVVCPSRWLADCARQSAVLQNQHIEVIGNGIDARQFKPLDRLAARRAFNLPADKKLILFGAVGGTADPRKGFDYLRAALQGLPKDAGLELVVFGAQPNEALQLDLPLHQVGSLHDTVSLNMIYSACDVFVLPALQENLPNTVLEALACGTPCVAFDAGGTADLIDHRSSGYLARYKDRTDLLAGIHWALAHAPPPQSLHQRILARYDLQRITAQHLRLYRSLLPGGAS